MNPRGHCVYCGGAAAGVVCQGHRDLPRLDPLFKLARKQPQSVTLAWLVRR